MERSLPCPHCKKPVPLRGINAVAIGWKSNLCPSCNAPVRLRLSSDLASYFLGAAVAVFVMWLLMPYIKDYFDVSPSGRVIKSFKNLLLLSPLLATWAFVKHLLDKQLGALVLANPKWPLRLTPEQRKIMREHSVSHNGEYFAFGEMHFDKLEDAVVYAQQANHRRSA